VDPSEYLRRRDPSGRYVIVARGEARRLLEGLRGAEIEELGSKLIVRVRSRSLAARLLRRLAEEGLLAD